MDNSSGLLDLQNKAVYTTLPWHTFTLAVSRCIWIPFFPNFYMYLYPCVHTFVNYQNVDTFEKYPILESMDTGVFLTLKVLNF